MKKIFIFILIIIIQSLLFCDLFEHKKYDQEVEDMSFNLVSSPTGGVPVNTDDYDSQNQILQALLYNLMNKTNHLTEWDTLNTPDMAKGVYVSHGGAMFLGNSDTAIGGAPANGRVYIKVARSGNALTFTFVNSAAGYSWDHVYCGFYHANGSQLLPYVLWKNTNGIYKHYINKLENYFDITSTLWVTDIEEIGDWDMNTANQKSIIPTRITDWKYIRDMKLTIRNDANTLRFSTAKGEITGASVDLWVNSFDGTDITFVRLIGGLFDNVNYDSTSYNRGWIKITYAF